MLELLAATLADADPALVGLLDEHERERHAAIVREEDRARFLLGVALSRIRLGALLGIEPAAVPIIRTCERCGSRAHGRPRLEGAGTPCLSVAHSADRVLVAVADRDVGVDVEGLGPGPDPESLLELVLVPEEREAVMAGPAESWHGAFLRLWTRKEAVLKLAGRGLAVAPRSVWVSGPADPPRLRDWPEELGPVDGIALKDLDVGEGHVAALAVRADRAPERVPVTWAGALLRLAPGR